MLILSQDKKRIINLDNIEAISVEDFGKDCAIFVWVTGKEFYLGKYFNEDKAKKVLQEILENYNYITRGLADKAGGTDCHVTCWYEMPED